MGRNMEMANFTGLAFLHVIQSQMNLYNTMRVNGGVACLTDLECIRKLMEIYIQEHSEMVLNTEKELNYMEMGITIKDSL